MKFQQIENDIYFKCGKMIDFSHYGKLYSSFLTETKNQYEIKKFNLETGQYEHTNEITEFEINGRVVDVINGFTSIETSEPEPTLSQEELQAEILLNQQNIIARQDTQELVLSQLLLNQQGGSVNV